MIVERKLSMLLRQLFSGGVVVGLSLMTHSVMAQEVTQSTTDTSAPAQVQKNKVAETKAEPAMQRVEITGSSIKRVAAQGALPVTVMKTEDLAKAGVTTAQEALQTISSNQSSYTTSSNVGSSKSVGSAADLRGLGASHTLVLLNGRRLANAAFDGTAVDLNIIPIAALDRVEILRDGASAIYGTDAIGGVINFITKRSYSGLNLSAEGFEPQQSGGAQQRVNISGGYGDLDADGYNVWGTFDYHKQNQVMASQRAISSYGGVNPNTGTHQASSFAPIANWFDVVSPEGLSGNPSAANGCNFANSVRAGDLCRYNTQAVIGIVPKTVEMAFLGQATFKLNEDNNLKFEYLHSESKVTTTIAADPMVGDGSGDPATDYAINSSSPFYAASGSTTGNPLSLTWRGNSAGPRVNESQNASDRFLVALDGTVAGWDYKTGAAYAQSTAKDSLNGGYLNNSMIREGFWNGTLNPFGPQTAAGTALLNQAGLSGVYESAKTQTETLDFTASRSIATLPAGDLGFAIGAEARHESASYDVHQPLASLDASTGGADAQNAAGSRNVGAVFTELSVPIVKNLDMQLAARYDHYSDAGGTFNPKIALRFQPMEQLLFRTSYSTGFRAPSLYELNDPQSKTFTQSSYNDPTLCPGGVAIPGANAAQACNQQFYKLQGGNPNLQPEKSTTFTLGTVFEPVKNVTMSIDYWNIQLKNQVSVIPEADIFANPIKYANLYVRNPVTGALEYVLDTNYNLGNTKTNGIDFGFAWRSAKTDWGNFGLALDGTYVMKYDYQTEAGGQYINNLAVYSNASVIFRWKHTATATWSRGPWSAVVQQSFQTGYQDENLNVTPGFANHHVGSYTLYNASGTYTGFRNLTLTAGIKNLFNTMPQPSNVTDNFQYGYDARYSDPIGRAFFVRANYKFF
ncbi:TonB-dependent receptor [Glaciimonas soli]|uniref:TonB-dependent receptor n=1 Tax=Glaciimonas soli TaxID=2590999 RepID=A0A843YRL7_9BURK|nr:TonB-dependent receptor [Glaciimonas soli]MQQ99911.1 TonB-dependent receptor [Glaciimonas soli]